HPATVAPAGSNRSGSGGNDTAEASDGKGCTGSPANRQAVTYVNAEQASKIITWEPTQQRDGEGRGRRLSGEQPDPACGPTGVRATACLHRENARNTGNPSGGCVTQPDAREGQAGPPGVAERPVVPPKPGNAGGGKGPQFQVNGRSGDSREIGLEPTTSPEGWQAAGDVARQSEERTHVPLLHVVRQGVPAGCAELRLPLLSGERRQPGRGRPDLRGHRGRRRGDVAG